MERTSECAENVVGEKKPKITIFSPYMRLHGNDQLFCTVHRDQTKEKCIITQGFILRINLVL